MAQSFVESFIDFTKESETMKYILLENDIRMAMIDDVDYIRVSQFEWFLKLGFIGGWCNGVSTSLGRFILNISDPKLEAEHKDTNIFNNQRNNLRVANYSQNNANRPKQFGSYSSIYKGVSFHRPTKTWHAKIKINKKSISLKYHKTEADAARAYDEAAKKYFGEFARTNF